MRAGALIGYLRCGPEASDLAAIWPVTVDRLAGALAVAGVVADDRQALEVHVRIGELLAEAELRRIDVEDHPAIIDAATAAALAPVPASTSPRRSPTASP